MLKDDYLIRAIERIVQALARLVLRKQAGQLQEAQAQCEDALASLTGLSPAALASMPPSYLMELLSAGGELDTRRALLLARFFKEQAELLGLRGDQAASQRWGHQALILYDEIGLRSGEQALGEPETTEAIAWLLNQAGQAPSARGGGAA